MMRKTLLSAMALGAGLWAGAGEAALLEPRTFDTPVIDFVGGSDDVVAVFDDGLSVDFFTAAPIPAVADGFDGGTGLGVDLFGFFDSGDASGGSLNALLSVENDAGVLLTADVVEAVGFDDDLIQILFSHLDGPAAAEFGQQVLVELVFLFPPVDSSPFANLEDGGEYEVAGVVSAVVIPLPATLPLLAAGLGAFAVARRRAGA